ncbi:hypothetical protein TGAM01_v206530 [Trichoderma gamsii]|uniref:Uncharacterized protein n=1 Tax=Trichoderma gamsii TaxID=398673 RepID=A0A2P4ZJX4_9HYPO|nr:hypothetical protein TGAM01_v206530 [Trichoderma gamsii]PON24600.1 hypothetical protein TGAM01_v206530 [Trichoderma gamsii]
MAIILACSYKRKAFSWSGSRNILTVCTFTLSYTTVTQQQQAWTRKVTQAKATRSRLAAAARAVDNMENHHPALRRGNQATP